MTVLQERISDRHIPPGVKLVEQDLSKEFGVSRTAIREVLSDLENQGLVERKPNKGTVVRKVEPESLLEIYEIREVLEGLAARLAAKKSRPKDWEDLKDEFGKPFERIVDNLDFEGYLNLITKFRKRMVKKAKNRELSKYIDSIYAQIRIVQRRVIILPERIQKAIHEHREVLNAIIEGDPDKAEAMKRTNLRTAREHLRKYQKWIL
jgi:DNA-binding GntR family transcriptional regulator